MRCWICLQAASGAAVFLDGFLVLIWTIMWMHSDCWAELREQHVILLCCVGGYSEICCFPVCSSLKAVKHWNWQLFFLLNNACSEANAVRMTGWVWWREPAVSRLSDCLHNLPLLSVLSLNPRWGCSSGTQLDRSASEASSPATYGTPLWPWWSTTLQVSALDDSFLVSLFARYVGSTWWKHLNICNLAKDCSWN